MTCCLHLRRVACAVGHTAMALVALACTGESPCQYTASCPPTDAGGAETLPTEVTPDGYRRADDGAPHHGRGRHRIDDPVVAQPQRAHRAAALTSATSWRLDESRRDSANASSRGRSSLAVTLLPSATPLVGVQSSSGTRWPIGQQHELLRAVVDGARRMNNDGTLMRSSSSSGHKRCGQEDMASLETVVSEG